MSYKDILPARLRSHSLRESSHRRYRSTPNLLKKPTLLSWLRRTTSKNITWLLWRKPRWGWVKVPGQKRGGGGCMTSNCPPLAVMLMGMAIKSIYNLHRIGELFFSALVFSIGIICVILSYQIYCIYSYKSLLTTNQLWVLINISKITYGYY